MKTFGSRHKELKQFLETEIDFTCVNDSESLIDALNIRHSSEQWCLFIAALSTNLKALLFHNGNEQTFIYATNTKETHSNLKIILIAVVYMKYQWKVWVDFKPIALLLGLQNGKTVGLPRTRTHYDIVN